MMMNDGDFKKIGFPMDTRKILLAWIANERIEKSGISSPLSVPETPQHQLGLPATPRSLHQMTSSGFKVSLVHFGNRQFLFFHLLIQMS